MGPAVWSPVADVIAPSSTSRRQALRSVQFQNPLNGLDEVRMVGIHAR
jgi:hypothetical protein